MPDVRPAAVSAGRFGSSGLAFRMAGADASEGLLAISEEAAEAAAAVVLADAEDYARTTILTI